MYPIAIRIGRLTLSSYTLLLDAGLLIALFLFYKRAQRLIAKPERWMDGAIISLAAGILGARLGYVLANWTYFQEKQSKILKFWLGGLSWHGALAGALTALVIYCLARRISLWRLSDELARVAPIVGFFCSLGCLMAGCAYGREVFSPNWLAAELPDLFGVWSYRFNVQLCLALWNVAVLFILSVAKCQISGKTTGLYFLLNGIGYGFIGTMRGDSVPMIGQWRFDCLLDGLVACSGLLILIVVSSQRINNTGKQKG